MSHLCCWQELSDADKERVRGRFAKAPFKDAAAKDKKQGGKRASVPAAEKEEAGGGGAKARGGARRRRAAKVSPTLPNFPSHHQV